MAKQHGPAASYFSGRQGEVVGAKLKGGEYISRSYQPNVKNPNTLRQRVSRLRMSTASGIASALSAAIQQGFAKATASSHMYPRNMFVRDAVRMDGMNVITVTNETATVNYENIKVSQRIGLNAVPAMGQADFNEPLQVKQDYAAINVTDVLPAGKLGIVSVVYAPSLNMCVVKNTIVEQGREGSVTVDVPPSFGAAEVHVYHFLKWVPESRNGVNTQSEPWMYPSETGETVYGGTGTIG